MKKVLALFLLAGMLASVSLGCGGTTTSKTSTTVTGPASTTKTTTAK